MQTPLKFSIVIANYNYGRFVSRAIDSALGLDWPDVEVVVVDDGSTDHHVLCLISTLYNSLETLVVSLRNFIL